MSGRPARPLMERFFANVLVTDGCWLWQAETVNGYGRFWTGTKAAPQFVRAHRWLYQQVVGPIPQGLTLDHLCRVRSCVNPDHLEPISNRENILRGTAPSARAATATHCPQGHPYDDANTYRQPGKTRRDCRACHRARSNQRWQRIKAGKP